MSTEVVPINKLLGSTPDQDFVFDYLGFGIHQSQCNVKVWNYKDKIFVLLTDLNKGTSVTNACETIITDLVQKKFTSINLDNIAFAEMYIDRKKEPIDLIIPKWQYRHRICTDVEWVHWGTITLNSN